MCGFAGGLLFDRSSSSDRLAGPDTALLDKMGEVLRHRGPDDRGCEVQGPCGLVHRRLSVIDLSRSGRQPMCSSDESVWIVYNGEVYNFSELRSRFSLDSARYRFRSSTDTEVLLHLYEELGDRFLEELNGMYSLAIWDGRKQRLLLARDPFGIKPLFYTETSEGFWFASEIKALLQIPGVERKPSLRALDSYLAFDYVPQELTPFQGIMELAPGCAMTIEQGTGKRKQWEFFTFDYSEDPAISSEEAVRTSRELLEKAVKRTLISDVPVGVMLSGGLDSSTITALMAEIRGDGDFHTFSLGFSDSSFDESGFAAIVARQAGTSHHRIDVTPGKVAELLPGYLAHIDEPYADGSAIPTWLLAAEASKFVTVLLSGEGGDEVFAGYDTYAAFKARRLYRRMVPGFIRRNLIGRAVNLLPVSHRKLSFEFKAKRFSRGSELDVPESHYFWRMVLSGDARREILHDPERFSEFPEPSELFSEIYSSCRASSDLNRLLCIDTSCHLPHDLMIKNDRMTMAHSIEARVPFTDTELFRFLARVPVRHKMPGMKKKVLLKKAMQDLLPGSIIHKKKVGLEMPYSKWIRSELRDITMEYLKPSRLTSTGLFDPAGVKRLWDEHDSMKVDHGRALWGILNYMMWHDMYISSDDYLSHIRPGVDRP
jgi:asparagine synthase (glutamine-hydrolysing)